MAAERADVRTELTSALAPVVESADLLLEDVILTGPAKHRTLRVVVDLPDGPGGVDSDRLADVTRSLSNAMDDLADRIPGSYTLEVTTAGVDRMLRTPRHFRRAEGRSVTVETDSGPVTGRVLFADDETLALDVDGAETTVPLASIRSGRINLDFRRTDEHA